VNDSMLKWQQFDAADFHHRWTRARTALLKVILAKSHNSCTDHQVAESPAAQIDATESELVRSIPPESHEELLRGIFDVSRKFAINVGQFFGVEWELSDLQDVLCVGPIPCCNGDWQTSGKALVVNRKGCQPNQNASSILCDYYREALDGLVMGICSDERIARHASVGHGDEHCMDVYFIDSSAGTRDGLRMAPVPQPITERITPVKSKLERQGQKLEFKGYAEGVLFYTLHSDKGPTCGAAGRYFHELVAKEVNHIFPHFRLQDAAPLAVYGEGTK
jgi:hypothetical protein